MLCMEHSAFVIVDTLKVRGISLFVVVVSGAIENKLAAYCDLLPCIGKLRRNQPAFVGAGPVGGDDLMVVANMLLYVILSSCLANLVENFVAIGDNRTVMPGLETVTIGVHVAVGANARVAKQIPGAAADGAGFEDHKAVVRAIAAQLTGTADAGKASADNQHIDRFKLIIHSYLNLRSCCYPKRYTR